MALGNRNAAWGAPFWRTSSQLRAANSVGSCPGGSKAAEGSRGVVGEASNGPGRRDRQRGDHRLHLSRLGDRLGDLRGPGPDNRVVTGANELSGQRHRGRDGRWCVYFVELSHGRSPFVFVAARAGGVEHDRARGQRTAPNDVFGERPKHLAEGNRPLPRWVRAIRRSADPIDDRAAAVNAWCLVGRDGYRAGEWRRASGPRGVDERPSRHQSIELPGRKLAANAAGREQQRDAHEARASAGRRRVNHESGGPRVLPGARAA